MNIFVLSKNPKTAAKHSCDSHCSKMILETAQILCSAFEPGEAPYKRTHYNHPCCKWARESKANYDWLIRYGEELSREFEYRFVNQHKSSLVIEWCKQNISNLGLSTKNSKPTPFVQCMPETYQIPNDPVQAYRNFYIYEKSKFAKWKNGRKRPYWYKPRISENQGEPQKAV